MALDSHTSSAVCYFYPGPHIVVTNTCIETPGGLFHLHDLVVTSIAHHYAHPARTVAMFCAAVELALAAPLAVIFGSALMILAGLVAAAGMGGAVVRDGHRNPRLMELRALHRGVPTILFSSANKTEFEQVRRAVIRAVEAGRRPLP
ncbi:DUF6232 family protein [Actinoplanes palleronii]|uniref:Uncharacterized protein n=1 Tax=Actinoplanes palleronii TaxID=113570 RepID=A0ABQ4B8Y7_9ACTN|nr:DUF6232 family protein [Actinoplanes palleronii]GIE67062.1 hypothetical protein Apa02nite_031700 [Actinoplanes palleronii]